MACGALDQHSTRECRQGVNCFRCGGRGHKSAECTQPRRGFGGGGRRNGWANECKNCGSVNHAETVCPTLFRIYWYNDKESHEQARLDKWKEYGASKALGKRKNASKRKYRDEYDYRSSDSSSSSEEEGEEDRLSNLIKDGPPNDWDPAQKWCYNCAGRGHWGDDCPVPRCNPLRATGDPSVYSELLANSGPFGSRYVNSRREMRRQTEDQNLVSIVEDHSGSFDRDRHRNRFDALDEAELFTRRPKTEATQPSYGGRFSRKNRDKKSDLQDRISGAPSLPSKKFRKRERKANKKIKQRK